MTINDDTLNDPKKKKDAIEILNRVQSSCKHNVYVHFYTIYVDDGLCNPDFKSSYRCMACGSTEYNVPANRNKPNTHCIKMSQCKMLQKFSDEEKFAVAEYVLVNLIKQHPLYDVKEIIKLLNNTLAEE